VGKEAGSNVKVHKTSGGRKMPVRHTIPIGIVIFLVVTVLKILLIVWLIYVGLMMQHKKAMFHILMYALVHLNNVKLDLYIYSISASLHRFFSSVLV